MLGYRPPLWWAFDDEETGDEMSSTPYEEHQLGELRARLAALHGLPWVEKLDKDYPDWHVVYDSYTKDVAHITPWMAAVEENAAFIAHAPAEIRALLDLHDQDQARIAALEAALRDILNSDKARMPEGYCSICGEWHGRNPAKDAECMFGRAVMALEGNDNE